MIFVNVRDLLADECERCGRAGHPEDTWTMPTLLIVNGLCFDCYQADCLEEPVEALLDA